MNLFARAARKLKHLYRHHVARRMQRVRYVGQTGGVAVELRISDLPREAVVGQTVSCSVCAVNVGPSAWTSDNPLSLEVRWRHPGTTTDFAFDQAQAIPLPLALAPGEKMTFAAPFAAPNTATDFDLAFEVVSARDGALRMTPTGGVPRCRVLGADPNDGRKNYDYRDAYAEIDLDKDYWTIVGPGTKEEFERLGRGKTDALILWGLTPDSRILDVGCGTGQLAQPLMNYLSDRGAYVGTDLAGPAIAFCKRRYVRPNFRFLQNDMTSLPISGEAFDVIYLGSVFTHMFPEEIRTMLGELRDLLAPGGMIVADAFHSTTVKGHIGTRDMVVIEEPLLHDAIASVGLTRATLSCIDWNATTKRTIFKLCRAA